MRAQTMQVDVLAVTDHDTVAGLHEAHEAQQKHAKKLRIIDGVEISTGWHSFDIHIVGLAVDRHCPQFLAMLENQQKIRDERAEKIADKLEKCGFEGVLDYAKRYAGVGQITRAHFARALVNNYGVSTPEAAFRKYLGKGKRAAVKAHWPEMAVAIEAIHAAGGVAVLAHPIHYDMTTKWLRRLVDEFCQAGGKVLEVADRSASPDKIKLIEDIALQHDMLVSAGSDFHFPSRWTELGRCARISEKLTPVWHDWSLAKA